MEAGEALLATLQVGEPSVDERNKRRKQGEGPGGAKTLCSSRAAISCVVNLGSNTCRMSSSVLSTTSYMSGRQYA